MFAVTPKTDCPHLSDQFASHPALISAIDVRAPCSKCRDPNENWVCLRCFSVFCSRHVHGHGVAHFRENGHSVAASFSDFSTWCYLCDSYIVHPTLQPVKEALHRSKFGTANGDRHSAQSEDDSSSVEPGAPETTSRSDAEDSSYEAGATDSSNDLPIPPTELMRALLGVGGQPPRAEVPPPPHVLSSLDLEGIAAVIRSGTCKRIIVCAGAGISVAAGIPDFRSPGTGLYDNLQKYNLPHPTAVFELDYFRQRPQPFYTLAKELYPGNFKPTAAHYLVRLLHEKGLLVRHFTQNIDTLERIAGVPGDKLVEAHGSFASAHCVACRCEYSQDWVKEAILADRIPYCKACKELVKPDITFFGEQLPPRFFECLQHDFPLCDLLLVIGTSLQVQPFASLIGMVDKRVPRLLINREKVGKYNPLMALLGGPADGFLFDESYNYRDVFLPGDIQEGVAKLAELLGWKDELDRLVAEGAEAFAKQQAAIAAAPPPPPLSPSSSVVSSPGAGASSSGPDSGSSSASSSSAPPSPSSPAASPLSPAGQQSSSSSSAASPPLSMPPTDGPKL